VEARFDDIALGRLGPKPVHYLGDTSTPTGEFRIDAINHQSNYTLFFRLNYPTVAHATLALAAGKITAQDHERIALAEWQGRPPPHDTPLGGMIGIHGIGRGSLKVHRDFNWTEGCVALDNQQIHALARYVRVGMRVIIRE
jgi:murein L,D-transpeptidase YafK